MRVTDKRISKRSRVGLCLLKLQLKHKRVIGFNELWKASRLSRKEVSCAHDFLSDRGMIDEQWYTYKKNGEKYWAKGMKLDDMGVYFFTKMRDKIRKMR
jgi:hypothetical protein